METSTETDMSPEFSSTIKCPHCGHEAAEAMPSNACVAFYPCSSCGVMLRPKPGDCCVFCSYGTVPCPPIQAERAGVAGAACCGADIHG